jgi:hypothetical protein
MKNSRFHISQNVPISNVEIYNNVQKDNITLYNS